MTVSIVIVTYNSSRDIEECLGSIQLSEGLVVPFELIVIDNASSDSTTKKIRSSFPDVRLIELAENTGFAAAANVGASHATGEFLLFLNPDTVLPENFCYPLAELFKHRPEAAIIGCDLVDLRGNHQPSCWKTPNMLTLIAEMFLPYKISLRLITQNPASPKAVDMVSGACMAVRRQLFDRLNGFDTRFFMYYEDADLCLRLREEGWKVFYTPTPSVLHYIGRSSSDGSTACRLYFVSKLSFYRKHRPSFYYRTAYVIVLLGIVVRTVAYIIVGSLTFNKSLLRLAKVFARTLKEVLR